jgi:hypothetical protein
LPDSPWLDEGVPAPFDLPIPDTPQPGVAHEVAELLPDRFEWTEAEARPMIYRKAVPEEPLTQGDILDDCPLLYWDVPLVSEGRVQPRSVTARVRVVVLTQACDLAQAKTTRVLVAIVHRASQLVEQAFKTGFHFR